MKLLAEPPSGAPHRYSYPANVKIVATLLSWELKKKKYCIENGCKNLFKFIALTSYVGLPSSSTVSHAAFPSVQGSVHAGDPCGLSSSLSPPRSESCRALSDLLLALSGPPRAVMQENIRNDIV